MIAMRPRTTEFDFDPEFVCSGRGISPVGNYLVADRCHRNGLWDLKRPSFNFCIDGVIWVSAGGKRNCSPDPCKTFDDYFGFLYAGLLRSHETLEILRLIGSAILLEQRWQLRSKALENELAEESDADFSGQSDTKASPEINAEDRPGSDDRGKPVEVKPDDTFSTLFRRLYSRRTKNFDPAEACEMVFKAEELLDECLLSKAEQSKAEQFSDHEKGRSDQDARVKRRKRVADGDGQDHTVRRKRPRSASML